MKSYTEYTHQYTILENERDTPCHEYIYKYIIMHGSGVLLDRGIRRISDLTFEVRYVFANGVNALGENSQDIIIRELNKINQPL